MRQLSSRQPIGMRPQGLYVYGRSPRGGPRGARRWQRWQTQGLVPLLLGGLLCLVAVVLSQPMPSPGERSPVAQTGHMTPVVMVQADTLPPVLHRIAHCESRGQHFTKEGRVVRGTQHAADIGLFQINTVVWGKKAQELGYDLHTPEGNTRMARYLFENYGSVPWQSSVKCWNRLS
jgi:hypothetical protein